MNHHGFKNRDKIFSIEHFLYLIPWGFVVLSTSMMLKMYLFVNATGVVLTGLVTGVTKGDEGVLTVSLGLGLVVVLAAGFFSLDVGMGRGFQSVTDEYGCKLRKELVSKCVFWSSEVRFFNSKVVQKSTSGAEHQQYFSHVWLFGMCVPSYILLRSQYKLTSCAHFFKTKFWNNSG